MPALAIDQASTALSQHAAAIVLAHLLLGAVTLMMLESWAPSDALYFCVTTLTTVGYGDLAPKTQSGRLFTSLHVLMGCSLVASCLGTLVGRMQAGLMEREGGAKSSAQSREINELVKALGVAGAIVIVGVAYASFVEGWGLVDAIYWAAVSCTSVGLGDLAPSPVMRPIAGIYLLLAVGGFAAAIGRVARFAAAFELGRRRDAFVERGVTTEILEQIDTDGNGVVSRAQFVRYMLVASGMVEEVEIAKLDSLFDALDADGSGSLDAADIRRGVVAGCNSQLHAGPGGRGRYVEVTTSSRTSSGPDSPSGGPSGFGTSFARSMLGGSGTA